MKKKILVFVSLVLIAMFAMTGAVSASDLKIGIVCSAAGQNDNGYNQSAVEGAKQVSEELGIDYKVIDAFFINKLML